MRASRTMVAVGCLTVALVPLTAAHGTTRSRYRVTAVVPAATIVGESMTLHGRVSPHAGGTRVRVQVRLPGASSFQTLRTARVHTDGRYHAAIRATLPGVTRYRVVEPASRGHRRGRSPVQLVTVSQWRTLASVPLAPVQPRLGTVTSVASADLNGVTFAPALEQTFNSTMQEGLVVYDLGRRCTRLTTWVGAAPPQSGDSPTSALVYVDTGTYDGQLNPAANVRASPSAPHPVRVDVGPDVLTDADVLALDIRLDTMHPFTVEWGAPEILCSF